MKDSIVNKVFINKAIYKIALEKYGKEYVEKYYVIDRNVPKSTKKEVIKVWGHQDITTNVFRIHKGPVEKCEECQKYPKLVEWNKYLKKIKNYKLQAIEEKI